MSQLRTAYEKADERVKYHRRQVKNLKLTQDQRQDHQNAIAYYESIPAGLSAFASWEQYRGSYAHVMSQKRS